MTGTRLKDKVAIITGAGRGMGRAIAMAMAEEGANVVVNDAGVALDGSGTSEQPADEVVSEIQKNGGMAVASHDSVATMEGGEVIVKTAVDNFGKVDILVHVAGILRNRMIYNMTEEEWDSVIAVHLKGCFACLKPASLLMKKQKSGRIINFTSDGALQGAILSANYNAAKGGILGLTRAAALELGEYGITVNAISPAAQTRLAEGGQQFYLPVPECVAQMVIYLASNEAAGINGQVFGVAGGRISIYCEPRLVKCLEIQGNCSPELMASIFPYAVGMGLFNPGLPDMPPAEMVV